MPGMDCPRVCAHFILMAEQLPCRPLKQNLQVLWCHLISLQPPWADVTLTFVAAGLGGSYHGRPSTQQPCALSWFPQDYCIDTCVY